MKTSAAGTTGLFAAALAAAALSAQQPAPTFRSGVDAVLLDVRIVDGDGRFVPDLTAADVKVFEDGREQAITAFERVDIPIREDARPLFSGRTVDADVSSNAGEGRLYVLLLDDYHTHPFRSATVRALARDFIEHHLTESDRAVVLTTSGRAGVVQEFTNHRQRLLDIVDKFEGGFQSSTRCALVAPPGNEVPNARTGALVALPALVDSGACQIADDRSSLESLSSLAAWLGGVRQQRKAIVFFSEGFDGRMSNAFDGPEDDVDAFLDDLTGGSATRSKRSSDATVISDDIRRVLDAAARANVSIYAIDPSGDPNQPAAGIKPAPMLADENVFDSKHLQSRLMLQALAKSTGGAALTRSNDFGGAFTRVVADTSSYYLVGFVPSNGASDGSFRKIDVRPQRPGLSVQARTGYTARNDAGGGRDSSSQISPALRELMATPAEVQGLTIRAAAPAFMGKGSKASVEVVVELAGRELISDPAAPASGGRLDLAIAAADADGHVKAKEQGSLEMNFSPAVRTQISEHGLRLVSRLEMPPGRYLLRVAGTEPAGHNRGSVQLDLDVPDFSKGPLTMSGLALAASSERERPTTGSDVLWKQRFAEAPTASRTFPRGTELRVSGEIYVTGNAPDGIDTTATVRRDDGAVVFDHRETLRISDRKKPATYRHESMVSTEGMEPGAYLLTVEARNGTAGKPVAREVPFVVVDSR